MGRREVERERDGGEIVERERDSGETLARESKGKERWREEPIQTISWLNVLLTTLQLLSNSNQFLKVRASH